MSSLFEIPHLFNRRLFIILLLGFSAGLPLALTSHTLQAWFTVAGVDIMTIGLLGFAGQPYLYKFLWAPLLDRFAIASLGRRRGWMLVTQGSLLLTIIMMAFLDPTHHPVAMGMLALLIAFLSASQDIAIDAFRTDVLPTEERGSGAAMYMYGYRIAMIISGGMALIMADNVGWHVTYLVIGSMMLLGMIASWYAIEPDEQAPAPTSLRVAIVEPLHEFLSRDKALVILLLIIFYKLGDAFITSFANPFLIRGLGFSLTEVGTVNKIGGMIATLFGVFAGGVLLTNISLLRALIVFGVCQSFANFLYMCLAMVGKNYIFMVSVVLIENVVNGMCTVAVLAFLMSLCDHRYTATQYALFSALASVGRVFISPLAGLLVDKLGWVNFFFWSLILTLPGLGLLWYLRSHFVFFAKPLPANAR